MNFFPPPLNTLSSFLSIFSQLSYLCKGNYRHLLVKRRRIMKYLHPLTSSCTTPRSLEAGIFSVNPQGFGAGHSGTIIVLATHLIIRRKRECFIHLSLAAWSNGS